MKLKAENKKGRSVSRWFQAMVTVAVIAGGIGTYAYFNGSSSSVQAPPAAQVPAVQSPAPAQTLQQSGSNLKMLGKISKQAASILKQGVVKNIKPGTLLLSSDASGGARDYTITVPANTSTISMQIWDYAAEDGDYVQILHNGVAVTDIFMIKNSPVSVQVPAGGVVEVKGIRDGGGGITYAVFNPETGNTYFNRAPGNGTNKYTIVQGGN